MKIEKKYVANIIPFGDVPEGTVFKDKYEAVCMKVAGNYEKSVLSRNAIDLETGSLYLYDDTDEVEVLENAVLTY